MPFIICPLSRTGDEVAGETADEIALNLAAGTRVALRFRKRPVRPCPDVWTVFGGYELSENAKAALRFTADVYAGFRRTEKRPITPAKAALQLAETEGGF